MSYLARTDASSRTDLAATQPNPQREPRSSRVVQVQAILRFLARRLDMLGATDAEACAADMVANGALDARMPLVTARFSEDPDAQLAAALATGVPRVLDAAERLLRRRRGGNDGDGGEGEGGEGEDDDDGDGGAAYVAGGAAPTYADVVLLEVRRGSARRGAP